MLIFFPLIDIFACQLISNEPSCEALTESSYSFFFWFVWLDQEGQSQLSFRSSDHMFTDVVGQIFTGRLFSRSSGFTKHWYTFHWKAQIRLALSSVTVQIIFTDYGAMECDTLNRALWDKQVMQCLDLSMLWARGKYPQQNPSQTAVVSFARHISVCMYMYLGLT